MEVIRTRGWRSAPLQGPARGARIRPGERPTWVELPVGRRWWPVWRRCAAAHNVAVDAWVAAGLELHAVVDLCEDPAEGRRVIADAVAAHSHHLWLAPTQDLREWCQRLAGAVRRRAATSFPRWSCRSAC